MCVQPTYKLDDKKKCRDDKGCFTKAELCHA